MKLNEILKTDRCAKGEGGWTVGHRRQLSNWEDPPNQEDQRGENKEKTETLNIGLSPYRKLWKQSPPLYANLERQGLEPPTNKQTSHSSLVERSPRSHCPNLYINIDNLYLNFFKEIEEWENPGIDNLAALIKKSYFLD